MHKTNDKVEYIKKCEVCHTQKKKYEEERKRKIEKKKRWMTKEPVSKEKNADEMYAIGYSIDNLVGAKNLRVEIMYEIQTKFKTRMRFTCDTITHTSKQMIIRTSVKRNVERRTHKFPSPHNANENVTHHIGIYLT